MARRSGNFVNNFMGIGLPTLVFIGLIAWIGELIWRYIWIVGPVIALVVLALILRARSKARTRRAAQREKEAGLRRIIIEADPDLPEEVIRERIRQACMVGHPS
jgi:flagellar biosynthesis/type III secretory pathway M-ring protein FliF/YscJ